VEILAKLQFRDHPGLQTYVVVKNKFEMEDKKLRIKQEIKDHFSDPIKAVELATKLNKSLENEHEGFLYFYAVEVNTLTPQGKRLHKVEQEIQANIN
jgi:hypothetical protein